MADYAVVMMIAASRHCGGARVNAVQLAAVCGKQALAARPDMREAVNMRGLVYAAMGENELAEESFRRALSLYPNDADTLHNYGWFMCQQQRWQTADSMFDQALSQTTYRAPQRTLLAKGLVAPGEKVDIQVVPVTLFWGRAPGREGEEASGWNIISSLAPNRLKKALIVILKGRENLVRFSPPLSLRYMADKHGTDEAIAHKLARVARTHFSRQQLAATGPKLPNRNLLHDRMDQALRQSRRTGERLAVMFLDLDRFKNINDTLGHLVGDDLLRHVAQRLSMALRASDTLARLGGDEFVVLLPRVDSRDQVAMVAEKLLSVLEAPMDVQEHALHISTSIGVCICPDDGDDADVLLRNADTAMYQAKGGGRNTYRFFTERMNTEAEQRYRIESALRVGVRDKELRLHFQPLVDMQTGSVFGAEALVRWQSGLLGLVSPGQFIPIAEETDLIVEIDSWVLTEACAHGARWRQDTGRDLMVAVNLSARQFRRKDLVPFVQRVLAESGLPPALLELEITESSLMHNVAEVIQTLDQLVALGVRLAIDDFGTGYSSLAYLKRFPVHKLKVDQSFVRDIGRTDSDLAIVKTVIALAHTLQLDLLAEGVETIAQLVTMRALGCERFQGYLFAKPVPADEVPALLALDVRALAADRS